MELELSHRQTALVVNAARLGSSREGPSSSNALAQLLFSLQKPPASLPRGRLLYENASFVLFIPV
jgi:hypothetical protein